MIYIIRQIIFMSIIGVSICSKTSEHFTHTAAQLSAPAPVDASPVVSAVLLECPKEPKLKSSKRAPCEDQLMVNIRVNPSFHIEKLEKFLILDEVYDPRRHCKAKIMSPYLIEISRGEPVMMYPLEFSKSVKCEGCDAKPATLITEKSGTPNIYPNEDLTHLNPEQDSLNRVIEKISSAFSPAMRTNNDDGVEQSRLRNEMSSNDPIVPDQSIKKRMHTNVEANHKIHSDKNVDMVDKESFRSIKSEMGHFSPDIKAIDNNKDGFLHNPSDHESLANVGIEEKFVSKLGEGGKLAQLGLVEPSRDSQSNNLKLIGKNDFVNIVNNINSIDESKLKKDKIENDGNIESLENDYVRPLRSKNVPLIQEKENKLFPEINLNENSNEIKGLEDILGLQQQGMSSVTGFREDSDEFNNEFNPASYEERNPIKQLKVMNREGLKELNNEFRPLSYTEHNPVKRKKIRRDENLDQFNSELRSTSYVLHNPAKRKKIRRDEDSDEFRNDNNPISNAEHSPTKLLKATHVEDLEDDLNNDLRPTNYAQHNPVKRKKVTRGKKRHKIKIRLKPENTMENSESVGNEDYKDEIYDEGNQIEKKLKIPVNFKSCECKTKVGVKSQDYDTDEHIAENVEHNYEDIQSNSKDQSMREANNENRDKTQNSNVKTRIGDKNNDNLYDDNDLEAEYAYNDFDERGSVPDAKSNPAVLNKNQETQVYENLIAEDSPLVLDKCQDTQVYETLIPQDSPLALNKHQENQVYDNLIAEDSPLALDKRQDTQSISDEKFNAPEEDKILMQRSVNNVLTPLDLYENSLGKLTTYRETDIMSEPTSDDWKRNDYDMLNGESYQSFNGKAANVGQKKNFGYVEVKALNFVPHAEKAHPRNSKFNSNSKYVNQKKLSNKQDDRERLRGNVPLRGSYTQLTFSQKPQLKISNAYRLPNTFYNQKFDMSSANRGNVFNNRDQIYLSKGPSPDAFEFKDPYDTYDRKATAKLIKPYKGSGFYDDDFYMNKDLMDAINNKNVENNEPQITAVKTVNADDTEYKPDYAAILSYGVTLPKMSNKEKTTGLGTKSLWSEPILPAFEPETMRDSDENGDTSKFKTQESAQYRGSVEDTPYEYSLNKAENIKNSYSNRPPISKVITDPHLSFSDKMHIIDTINPQSANEDRKINQFSREFDYTAPIMPTPYPLPIPESWKVRREHPKNIDKRSYLLYDDLSMRDTLKDNDYNFDDMDQRGLHLDANRHKDEDVQPCNSCGGKGKKPPTKTDSTTSLGGQDCGCQKDPSVCTCADKTLKEPRSVSDTCIQHECALAVPHNEFENLSQAPQHLVEDCTIDNPQQLIRNLCQRESLDFVLVPCRHIST